MNFHKLVAQELEKFDKKITPICAGFDEWSRVHGYPLPEGETALAVQSFLKSFALTIARATAEAGEVWDEEADQAMSEYYSGWNANNAERRRRLQVFWGDNQK